jgi:hypothetical protein
MGSGADRQLKVFRETHDLKAVLDYMAAETKVGLLIFFAPNSRHFRSGIGTLLPGFNLRGPSYDDPGAAIFGRSKASCT